MDSLALKLKLGRDFVLFLVSLRSFKGRLADGDQTIESLGAERAILEAQQADLIRALEQNQAALMREFSEERMQRLQACLDRAKGGKV